MTENHLKTPHHKKKFDEIHIQSDLYFNQPSFPQCCEHSYDNIQILIMTRTLWRKKFGA